ncbi:hypothetical protein DASB73_010820 [Starmerella bacillaris]|uniref:ATPase synthesis protein 25 n=1 Tax=Starmerella bacillaris TaxID=1247836 RepID=A0AAV5REY5_STABA|nr:hypothetical protein DASB73_010820 [Starmerella bacillaris]
MRPWYAAPKVVDAVKATTNLEKIIETAKKLGIKDLEIKERNHNENVEQLVIGTGKNSRHLSLASMQLKTFLKNEFKTHSMLEGLYTANRRKLEQRRAARKQQRQRYATSISTKILPHTWVAMETGIENISVHFMTAERREEIDFSVDDLDSLDDAEIKRFESVYSNKPETELETELETEAEIELQNELENELKNELKNESKNELETKNTQHNAGEPMWPVKTGIEDIDEVQFITDLVYEGQSEFAKLPVTDENLIAFRNLCDEKNQKLLEMYEKHMRPHNKSLLLNREMLTMLYRLHVAPAVNSVSNKEVLANPAFKEPLDAFYDPRCGPIRDLLIATGALEDIDVVAILLASLAHTNEPDSFWRVRHLGVLYSPSPEQQKSVNDLAIALAVRSGNKKQIASAYHFAKNNRDTVGQKYITACEDALSIMQEQQ